MTIISEKKVQWIHVENMFHPRVLLLLLDLNKIHFDKKNVLE